MITLRMRSWTRRVWLTQTMTSSTFAVLLAPIRRRRTPPSGTAEPGVWSSLSSSQRGRDAENAARSAAYSARVEPAPLQALVLRAVDAARRARATYADARFTRTVQQSYNMSGSGWMSEEQELLGLGVRALVNGYWGFAASAFSTPDDADRLAHDAVQQASENAKGPPRTVDLGTVPVVSGTWATPVRIDPFGVPIEEKLDAIGYWHLCAADAGLEMVEYGLTSSMTFARQERMVATSDGSLCTQTLFESGGVIQIEPAGTMGNQLLSSLGATAHRHGLPLAGQTTVQRLGWSAQGWELFLDAQIPEQFQTTVREALHQNALIRSTPSQVGRYTLVCDGATMASVVDKTLGVATQLDRALGYEADAGGTSFLDDPLGMVGHLRLTSPLVTLTANRSVPTQLATVHWDDEGVAPSPSTLITHGLVTDFQTTREQAAWLAPYYRQQGRPVSSNGCATAADAHGLPLQRMPNLQLDPNPAAVPLEALIADVRTGLLVEGGEAVEMDSQARNGVLTGRLREIKNGQLGRIVTNGVIQFNTLDFWKHLTAIGGATTLGTVGISQYDPWHQEVKGQPPQATSHTVCAAAAIIPNQAVIDIRRKA